MARASAKISEMTALEKISGFSAVAEAIALPAAPMPAPKRGQNDGQSVTEESVEQSTAISLVQSSSLVLNRARMGGRSLHKTYQTTQPSEASESERRRSSPRGSLQGCYRILLRRCRRM